MEEQKKPAGEDRAEAERRSARANNDLCNRIGLAFDGAQAEAFATWLAWEQEAGEAETSTG